MGGSGMRNEFTAIIELGDDGWYCAYSPEVPSANGQGRTIEEARQDLAEAIEFVLAVLREEGASNAPPVPSGTSSR
jgi:predicted RNase H-like HicB family nuclease